MNHLRLLFLLLLSCGSAFQLRGQTAHTNAVRPATSSASSWTLGGLPAASSSDVAEERDDVTSIAEQILDDFHSSDLDWRIIVIGGGAILETTQRLGPISKASTSPKTGERLLTFASEDKSFEFHVKVEQVSKICLVSSERCVARFLMDGGKPICSLLLADKSSRGNEWFGALIQKYGTEIAI
mmetsp:Transcript_19023/g.44570  ORF Transcript_19023/g.44570 Transcript_19023/m.44570 type:complete len:183 (+) Transcript_19023:75-623(+)